MVPPHHLRRSYHTDHFREFIISDGFTELYDIPPKEMKTLLTDDSALMLFGFRILKQVLFGENAIALHQKVADVRLEKAKEKEEEARAQRAGESNAMYENPD